MRNHRPVQALLAVLSVVLLPAAGCGRSAASGEDLGLRGSPDAGAVAAAASRAAAAASAAGAEQGCMPFRTLQAFLPPPPEGFRPLRAVASTGRYGEVRVSEAEQVFSAGSALDAGELGPGGERGARQLSVRIVDTSLYARIAESIRTTTQQAQAAEASRLAAGLPVLALPTRPLLFDSAVGYVSHRPDDSGRVEAMLLVGERFVVAVTGHGFSSTAEARAVLQRMDLPGLSRLAQAPIALGGR
ncbi:hypothetical protein FGE12_10405 [Aggregicoccus sp. 17bor-14]|uniref:hypothetical protein n=1 Tax=Myxococcaceae TaxID=31 RepID=UPI00129C11D1|nr:MULTISPECIES: hypothetical protein [Myxococcaceae]MBF5042804.1 hypothetical protein [Simulacricoccus sp. 17bor-14]MRI88572.1 hypothetical protein [Aggregicoccus sp. 17bor-14]